MRGSFSRPTFSLSTMSTLTWSLASLQPTIVEARLGPEALARLLDHDFALIRATSRCRR
jgi:hypothetical protein